MADVRLEGELGRYALTGVKPRPSVLPAPPPPPRGGTPIAADLSAGRSGMLAAADATAKRSEKLRRSPNVPAYLQPSLDQVRAEEIARDKPAAAPEPAPYADGGDGTVAREAPSYRGVSVAGGLDRGELLRRMEMASTSMRGSPSARAAVMGVYAEQLKAMDTAELQKNQGNVDTDQLAFKTNAAANMQEAEGRQSFGNQMGVLNRKAELDAAAAAAAANDPYRQAQLENLQSQTRLNNARGVNEANSAQLRDTQVDQETFTKLLAASRAKLGPDATAADVEADALRMVADSGNYGTNAFGGNLARARDAEEISRTAGQGSSWGSRLALSGDAPKYIFGGEPKVNTADTANLDYYDASGESWIGGIRRAFNAPVYKVYDKTQGDPRVNPNAPAYIAPTSVIGSNENDALLERLRRMKNDGSRTNAYKPTQSVMGE